MEKPPSTELARNQNESGSLLKDLILFIKSSSRSYDEGYFGEAHRLAVAIRSIVHGSPGTASILEEIGLTDLFFYDNCPNYRPEIHMPFSGLALAGMAKDDPEYVPRLGQNPNVQTNKVTYEQWWNKKVIVDEEFNIVLTREGVIEAVANTFSREQVDPKLNDFYNETILKCGLGWVDEKAALQLSMIPIEFASVRQIAYELIKALEEQIPQYC